METRKHSGGLEIAYQNLIPTFIIIRLTNHKFRQKVGIKF